MRSVLHIIIDDLSTEFSTYGKPWVRTPHIDGLAARGTLFANAFCQQALCVPSRASFFSGRTPESNGVIGVSPRSPKSWPDGSHTDWVNLPAHFKAHGWDVLAFGKLFHGTDNEALSFTSVSTTHKTMQSLHANNGWPVCPDVQALETWCALEGDETLFVDSHIAQEAAAALLEQTSPFYMLVGFLEPHTAWAVPQRWWDHYTSSADVEPHLLPPNPGRPTGAPPLAWAGGTSGGSPQTFTRGDVHLWEPASRDDGSPGGFGTNYAKDGTRVCWVTAANVSESWETAEACDCTGNGCSAATKWQGRLPGVPLMPAQQTRDARRAYFAAVSFVDEAVGVVLAALDQAGLHDETAVVLQSDHGYALGEHSNWHKYATDELNARVPLVISVPWIPLSANRSSFALVELLDLFPTLAALAGAPEPLCGGSCDGTDISDLLSEPDATPLPKVAAFTQAPRCAVDSNDEARPIGSAAALAEWVAAGGRLQGRPCSPPWHGYMGYSMRTVDWRLTAWVFFTATGKATSASLQYSADWASVAALELYAHSEEATRSAIAAEPDLASELHDAPSCGTDSGACENANLADVPGLEPTRLQLMSALEGWFRFGLRPSEGDVTLPPPPPAPPLVPQPSVQSCTADASYSSTEWCAVCDLCSGYCPECVD
tara:strand:+ start:244 stop:2214 length:1971 start_codon:yes stop_codon:yes gene_type:complete